EVERIASPERDDAVLAARAGRAIDVPARKRAGGGVSSSAAAVPCALDPRRGLRGVGRLFRRGRVDWALLVQAARALLRRARPVGRETEVWRNPRSGSHFRYYQRFRRSGAAGSG